MMEFIHMFNQQGTGHILRGSACFGIIPPPVRPESRERRRGAFSGPPSHQEWPWRGEPDFGHGSYAVATDEPWLDEHDFHGPFGVPDGNHLPGGTFPPPPTRSSVPSSPVNGSLSPPDPEINSFHRNCSHISPNRGGGHEHVNHHHPHRRSSPVREWETVMPEVFSPPGVTTPAYSVEELATPPLTDAAFPRLFPVPPNLRHRSPPDRSRRRRNSRASAHARTHTSPFQPQPSSFFDHIHLPSRTPRCETLPSSASSTAPSTPSRRPSSPAPSPRARSPLSFTQHNGRDADDQNREDHHRGPAHSFHTHPPPPPSPFPRHHRRHYPPPPPPPPFPNHLFSSPPLSPPPRHHHHQQQHMLLSAHQRTRRHLRALERELDRLGTTGFIHRHDDDADDDGRGGARARGRGPEEGWGLFHRGRREDWGGGGFGRAGLGAW